MMNERIGRVLRPSRYIGNEVNAVRKDLRHVDVKIALAFPDTYEIGMSHGGLKVLYEILNARADTAAERVYAPWGDMEQVLRSGGCALASLESNLPLKGFDILGFTLQYEMSYTNILNMLDLGGVPLLARDRGESFPLVIGGGPCAFNPEPLADFFDLFVIGDGEEVVGEIVDLFRKHKSDGRNALLRRLGDLEGVYVPAHFEVRYGKRGLIEEIRRTVPGADRVRKRVVSDLNHAPCTRVPVVPYMKAVHDRVALEIARGCTRGCRFCQAGMIYRPVRERDVGTVLAALMDSVRHSGYEEAALTSLSSGDYSALPELVRETVRFAEKRHVSISLPSLRPGTLSEEVISEIRKIRKTGFTLAPEAGTQRLREVINKGITDEDLLQTVSKVFSAGWEVLKLYFMIGLPTETKEDLEGIIHLSFRALKAAKAANPRMKQINISVSPFVPKGHTPFQWVAQSGPDDVREKYRLLKKGLRHKKITFKWHEPDISMLEGVFARGDRRLGAVLREAWKRGCRFDGWTEEFDPSRWLDAFQHVGVDPAFYAHRERSLTEILPWGHIDSGVTEAFLKGEYEHALKGETTADCRGGECGECGACDGERSLVVARPLGEGHKRKGAKAPGSPVVKRFRIRYAKEGALRFLSHLEVISVFVRAFARAGVPLEFSKGYHPHPRIAMGPALPVGVAGLAEYLDVNVLGSPFEESVADRLNQVLPEGMGVTGINWIPGKAPAISSLIRFGEYLIRVPLSFFEERDPGHTLETFLSRPEISVERRQKGRVKTLDIRPMIEAMEVHSVDSAAAVVRLMVRTGDKGGVRLDEVLREWLDLSAEDAARIEITRIGLYTDDRRTMLFQERRETVAR